jgi:hypothetical protein
MLSVLPPREVRAAELPTPFISTELSQNWLATIFICFQTVGGFGA